MRVFSVENSVRVSTPGSNANDWTGTAPPCTRRSSPWRSSAMRSLRIVSPVTPSSSATCRRVDAAVAAQPIEDVILALVGVRGTRIVGFGHCTATGMSAGADAPAARAASSAAPRAPASLTSALTSSPKRRRLDGDETFTARPAAGDDQSPVCSADCAHRVVNLGRLVGDRFERRSPQMRRSVAIGDAEDVQSAECRCDYAHLGHGQRDGLGVQGGQVGLVLPSSARTRCNASPP